MLAQKHLKKLFIGSLIVLVISIFVACLNYSDLLTNILADVVILCIAILGYLYSWSMGYGKVKRFFGIDSKGKLRIYVSSKEIEGQTTKYVAIVEELKAVADLKAKLQFHIKGGLITSVLSGIINFDEIDLSDVVIDIGQGENELNKGDGIIFVGGPVQNDLAEEWFAKSSKEWFDYKQEKKLNENGEPIIGPDGKPEKEFWFITNGEKIKSHNIAVLCQIKSGEKLITYAWGYGECQTAGAVRHLAANWQRFYNRHGLEEFGVKIEVNNETGDIINYETFYPKNSEYKG